MRVRTSRNFLMRVFGDDFDGEKDTRPVCGVAAARLGGQEGAGAGATRAAAGMGALARTLKTFFLVDFFRTPPF